MTRLERSLRTSWRSISAPSMDRVTVRTHTIHVHVAETVCTCISELIHVVPMCLSGDLTDPLETQPKVRMSIFWSIIDHMHVCYHLWFYLSLICLQRLDFSPFNPLADPDFCFYDDKLLESVKVGDSCTHEFFRLLSLCHTVMSEEKSEGELKKRETAKQQIMTSKLNICSFVIV